MQYDLANETVRRNGTTVLIYRDQLLPYSETFIPAQAEQLRRYSARYVGTTAQPGYSLPAHRQTLLGPLVRPSGAWKMAYKLFGLCAPSWLRALSAHHPQLLHAHFGGDGGFAIPLARQLQVPLIVTFHGYDATWQQPSVSPLQQANDFIYHRGRFFRTLMLQKRAAVFAKADRVIAVSNFIYRQLIDRGCPAEKIIVHYIGIDPQQFQPDPTVQRQPVVLFVGRLVEKKGCEYLIRAMASVQQHHPQAQLVIIGDGPLRSHLEVQAQQLAHVQFLGAQPPGTVRHWMNRAHCLAGPSITADSGDAEGLGMVFAEAQAMQLPVVAFASGGIPEVVQHSQTGLLAPEKDLTGLTRHLLNLFEDPGLHHRLAQAGPLHIAKKFDIRQNTRILEQHYDTVIQQFRAN